MSFLAMTEVSTIKVIAMARIVSTIWPRLAIIRTVGTSIGTSIVASIVPETVPINMAAVVVMLLVMAVSGMANP
jgi:hypothetical protein